MDSDKKVDRRIKRTKSNLRRALLELISEMGFDRVSVKSILNRANVGRTTFYAHFEDKEALLLDDLPQLIELDSTNGLDRFPSVAPVFHHARNQIQLYRKLRQSKIMSFVRQSAESRFSRDFEAVLKSLQQQGHTLTISPKIGAQLLAGALTTTLFWWLDSGMVQDVETLDLEFRILATRGVLQRRS